MVEPAGVQSVGRSQPHAIIIGSPRLSGSVPAAIA
jgi:hypothetical protein